MPYPKPRHADIARRQSSYFAELYLGGCGGVQRHSLVDVANHSSSCVCLFLRIAHLGRTILVCLMIPIAVVSNGMRVMGAALVTYFWTPRAAEGFLHTFSG